MAVKASDLNGFKFLEKTLDEEILRAQAQNFDSDRQCQQLDSRQ
jgi:hypothetical protein